MKTFINLIKSAVALLIATAATPSTAQIHLEYNGHADFWSIPGSLQCDGKGKLFLSNAYRSYGEETILFKLLDDNLQIEKEISYTPPAIPTRTVYQERKVNGYTEELFVYEYEEGRRGHYWETGKSLEEFCDYYNTLLEADHGPGAFNIKPEDFITIEGLYFLPAEPVDEIPVPTIQRPTVELYGTTYNPQNGLIIGAEYYRYATLSEEWETVKEVVDYVYPSIPQYVSYEDLATGINNPDIYVSQNFFNNDDKYEFIVTMCEENTEGSIYYTDYLSGHYGEEEYAYARKIIYSLSSNGYNVVNEDGNVLHTFTGYDTFNAPLLFKFNNKNYVKLEYSERDEASGDYISYFDIYEIDTQTSDIKKVQQLSGISIEPRTPQRNEPITVELLDKEADTNLEVVVTSTNGRVVQRTTLRAGNKGVRLNTSRMDAGFYNVTVLKNGKKIENAKVIVR